MGCPVGVFEAAGMPQKQGAQSCRAKRQPRRALATTQCCSRGDWHGLHHSGEISRLRILQGLLLGCAKEGYGCSGSSVWTRRAQISLPPWLPGGYQFCFTSDGHATSTETSTSIMNFRTCPSGVSVSVITKHSGQGTGLVHIHILRNQPVRLRHIGCGFLDHAHNVRKPRGDNGGASLLLPCFEFTLAADQQWRPA